MTPYLVHIGYVPELARLHEEHFAALSAPAALHHGHFVGEMSLLTGEPATADVAADELARAMVWPARELRAIRLSDPRLWTKIQSVIGHDLVEKIKGSTPTAHP